jgi:acyl transferase domain-containing protein/acyl carrier protein
VNDVSADITELRTRLRTLLAARLRLDSSAIDPGERFSRYGLDSASAVGWIAEISAELRRALSPTLVWAHPTLEELARHLAGEDAAAAAPELPTPPFCAAAEPIAIVGLACRFPGAPSLQAYWRMLCDGVDATRTVPADRWDAQAWYDPDPEKPGTINTRRGAFLDRVDEFDPLFFGISPREAAEMDPQQRLMIELAWEALEDAGIPPRSLGGSRTGVFAGVIGHDYAELHKMSGAAVTSHTGPGTSLSIVANRVSYLLGLRGPSLSVDTACSSSLVAVHLACQSLRDGESTLALAGGVNLILSPKFTVELTKFGGLSGDGRCKAFDARANGFARGEGGGMAVLKPLSRALADGDPIYCLIRGSAVNNDGASNGLTAPSPQAQVEVLREAYARAGVDPRRVHYVEAHGTGTRLGDPIEARALAAVLCAGRDPARPLLIGSAKTNIAHQEAAAGIAGLIKLALAIHHRAIPPSLHFETPNPDIPFEELRLRVQTALGPWPAYEERREPAAGGVSSFGWGGTNSHAVLEEFSAARAQPFLLSAASLDELRDEARRLLELAGSPTAGSGLSLQALCAAVARRPAEDYRLAASLRSRGELADCLQAFLAGRPRPGLASGQAGESSGLVFVFSGMGSQWPGMARELLREPLFRARLERFDRVHRPLAGWSLIAELAAGSGERWSQAVFAIPLLVALEVAQTDLWRSWGIAPDAVVGHSIGEIAAAYAAGVLSIEESARVAFWYGRAVGWIDGRGAMGVVELPPREAGERLAAGGGRLELVAHLSPGSAAVAGPPAEVDAFLAMVRSEGRFAARVAAGAAAHSSELDPYLPEALAGFPGIAPRRPRIPLISTLTGSPLDGPMDAAYWVQSLRQPVRFAQAMEHLLAAGYGLFLELDAHPILAAPLQQCFVAACGVEAAWLPTLRRGEGARTVLFDSLAALWLAGRPVRRERLFPDAPAEGRTELVPLSARTPEALSDLARATAGSLRERETGSLPDLAWSAAARRGHHEHRLAAVVRSPAELAERLEAFSRGEEVAGLAAGRSHRGEMGVVFAFSGQGPQWRGMGRQLLAGEPVFREAFERCDELLRPWLGEPLIARLDRDDAGLDHTGLAQPALFAVQVSLAVLWRSWGIVPAAVVGHSAGEIAAAHVAGVLSLEQAARVAAVRGRSMDPAWGRGGMAAVELSEEEARAALPEVGDGTGRLWIAAVNSPGAVAIAGSPAALESAVARLQARGITCRRLRVAYPFHGPLMEPFDREVEAELADLRPRPAAIPMISTVTGAAVAGPDLGGAYWRRNVREPVRFADAVGALAEHDIFLEIGPHPVLAVAISQGLDRLGRAASVLASLRRGRDERETMLEALGALYALGLPVDWAGVHPDAGRFVRLPAYPFQRQRYWFQPASSPSPDPARGTAAPSPVRPESNGLEQLLGWQLDAFQHMVSLQLGMLQAGPNGSSSEDL